MAWEETIYKLKITDPVIGGGVVFTPDGGVSAGYANAAAVQLENRTDVLKEQVDGVINDNGALEVRVDDLEDKQIADKQELEESIATKANTIHTHTASDILDIGTFVDGQIDAQKAVASGLATLGADGKVPQAQLPSYVDDVLEFESLANFPPTGESGKIYIAIDTGSAYRWTGSSYFKINNSVSTADEALKLTNSRTIAATGDATWSVPFNGTANVSATLTLSNTGVASGIYKSVTVDAKGRVTAGTNPTTLSGYGITDATPSSHIGTGGTSHAAVTTTTNGFMSSTDKSKLDGIAAGAQVNSVTSVQGRTGAVVISKTDVSLGSVENYPVATQVQAIAASVDTAYMTPLKTKQLVESGGVVVSADKLRTPISVSLTGGVTGTAANWDAGTNLTITTSVVSMDASKISSGTLPDARLPGRLGTVAATITDWNTATSNGWFMSSDAANAPEVGAVWFLGSVVTQQSARWCTQTVHGFTSDGASNTKTWRREQNGGTWGIWYRLRLSEAEQSAIYLNASNLSSGTIPSARLPSSGVVSGTYTKVTVDDTGRVTTGSSLVAADIPNLDASKVTTGTMAVARLPAASTSAVGVAQLNSTTNSTSTTQAATPSAVKAAYDLAAAKISSTEKGVANGVATLGSDGKVPATQLPSYVDDVIEVSSFSNLPATGESGKIYVTTDTNDIYRWSGSGYIEIAVSAGTADTALRLATARTLSLTGDGSGSVAFDGSGDAAIPLTLSNTGVSAGTYPKVTVDGKGRVTAGSSLAATDIPALDAGKITSGVIADARLPTTQTGKVFSSGVVVEASNNLRFKEGAGSAGYGVVHRHNGSAYYMLVTADGDADGSWTAARPFTLNLRTGTLAINGNSGTATKLESARRINNVLFDGSADITVTDDTKLPLSGGTLTGTTFSINPASGNAALEIGSTRGVANTPSIDFHSGATATDYDSRIIANGGNGVAGNGTLKYQAALHGFDGKIEAQAPVTTSASLTLPHGTAPTTLVNGDMWTTTSGLYARINGNTRDLYHSGNLADVSQAEAEAGTATTSRAWTAQRVRQAVIAVPEKPLEIKSANFTSAIGMGYFCTANLTATLPNPLAVTIPNGSLVRFNKANSAIVTVNAVNANISTDAGEDTSVIIDITEEVLFTFYNNKWWV